MKKTLSILALTFILIVSLSAHTSRVIAPKTGYTVPTLSIESNDSIISLSDYKGKYLLLTFWSSTDAPSRIRCKEYESLNIVSAKMDRLALNVDENQRLFQEIVANDNLNPKFQLSVPESQKAAVIADFGLNDGLNSFLIDPQGRIIAINPSTEMIASI